MSKHAIFLTLLSLLSFTPEIYRANPHVLRDASEQPDVMAYHPARDLHVCYVMQNQWPIGYGNVAG